jgi:hypothetical protein
MIRMLGENLSLERLRGLLRLYRTLSQGAAEVLVGQWILHDQGTQPVAARHSSQYQDSARRNAAATDGQTTGYAQPDITIRKSTHS